MNPIIALWSHPRALSTVFSRVMMERGDLTVIHEPFSNFCAQKFFEVDGERAETFSRIFSLMYRSAEKTPVFFKDTTEYHYPEVLRDPEFLKRTASTFIIRDPRKAIPSHYAVNPKVTREEIGYENQLELFNRVRELTGRTPVVMDADDLVANTPEMVKLYCERVQLPFIPEALQWERGGREEWKRTNHWHLDVNDSTGISKKEKSYTVTIDNNDVLMGYYRYHLPFYQQLYDARMTVPV